MTPTRRRALRATFGIVFGSATGGCLGGASGGREGTPTRAYTPAPNLSVRSPAFEPGGTIPVKHTCSGEGTSPLLTVERVPDGTAALALTVDDLDAANAPKAHWLLWNLPADTHRIPEGVPRGETVASLGGARQGRNDAGGEIGYAGPCPPKREGPHTYRFEFHALSRDLDVEPGVGRAALVAALPEARIARARLFGEYDRSLHVDPDDPIAGG